MRPGPSTDRSRRPTVEQRRAYPDVFEAAQPHPIDLRSRPLAASAVSSLVDPRHEARCHRASKRALPCPTREELAAAGPGTSLALLSRAAPRVGRLREHRLASTPLGSRTSKEALEALPARDSLRNRCPPSLGRVPRPTPLDHRSEGTRHRESTQDAPPP